MARKATILVGPILGVDPSVRCTGWAVLEPAARSLVSYGEIPTGTAPLAEALATIHATLDATIEAFQPSLIAWEQPFVGANMATSLKLAHVAGVVVLLAGQHGIANEPWTPSGVRRIVVGDGGATKSEVADAVKGYVDGPAPVFASNDASDAAAVAIAATSHWRTKWDRDGP